MILCRRVACLQEQPARWAKCRIGIVGKAGAAAAFVGPVGNLASGILPYLEVVGDQAELQDGRRFASMHFVWVTSQSPSLHCVTRT